MSQRESAVVYDGLRISSGGAHGLGRISAHAAHSAWSGFLSACTSPGSITCYFEFPVTHQLTVGPDVRELLGGTFPAEGRTFPVPAERVAEALDLLSALEPQPTNPWGIGPRLADVLRQLRPQGS